MTVTIELPPDTEAKLKEQSALLGKDPESLVLEAIKEKLGDDQSAKDVPYESWKAKFDELLASMPRGNPQADLSRESIYESRGE